VVAPSLEFSTISDHPESSLTIHDSSLPLDPLRELKEGDDFETDASLDDQCGTIVDLEDTFSEEHSLDEPYVVDFSEVTPPDELSDPFSNESHPNLGPGPPISSFFSPLPFFIIL